jgi:hypothetical protein
MKKLIRRPITREVPDRDPINLETIMIRLEPGSKLLRIWTKGRRTKYAVRYADIFRLALQMEARRVIAAKKLARR